MWCSWSHTNQVAMGIPLHCIPDIRRFYAKKEESGEDDDDGPSAKRDDEGCQQKEVAINFSPIDFLKDEHISLDNVHVMAARITAENPHQGFTPTSGIIERIQFQSNPNVWAYFSVGMGGGGSGGSANGGGGSSSSGGSSGAGGVGSSSSSSRSSSRRRSGGVGRVHEFADSQFGHVFAKGPSREAARKSLAFALKENLKVQGEVHTPVDYLVKLLETKEFKRNAIDTAWLDGLIKERAFLASSSSSKSPNGEDSELSLVDVHTTVAAAALYRAVNFLKASQETHLQNLKHGRVWTMVANQQQQRVQSDGGGEGGEGNTHTATLATVFSFDVTFNNLKYTFRVSRLSQDLLEFTLVHGNGEGGTGSSFVCLYQEQEQQQQSMNSKEEDGEGFLHLLATFFHGNGHGNKGPTTTTTTTQHEIVGQESSQGLKLTFINPNDGATTTTRLLSRARDPSELRSDVTGKVVRYLQKEGSLVERGQAFVEVEAMKMTMPIKVCE
jgi:acetyl-CoA carboxylase/biotin carboxylase 1